jgi:hypothetical protein
MAVCTPAQGSEIGIGYRRGITNRRGALSQPLDCFGVINGVRASGGVSVGSVEGDAERFVNGGGKVFRFLWRAHRMASDFVRRADDVAAVYAAAGAEDGLHCAPMIASGEFDAGEGADFRGAAKFTGHYDEGIVQQTAGAQVIDECA